MKSILTINVRRMLGGLVLFLACSSSALAVDRCAGLYSPGNPYQCYNTTTNTEGNCTWMGWYMANTVFHYSLPSWGNAGTWAGSAASANFPVSMTPGVDTIGVSSTLSTNGHVVWVLKVNGAQVYVREMQWGVQGWQDRWRNTADFNRGFIYPKAAWPRPVASWLYPYSPWGWNYNQWITLSGYYLYAPLVVDLTTPTGSTYTVQGSQLSYGYNSVSMYVTLNGRGTWSLRALWSNGQRSDPFYFTVK